MTMGTEPLGEARPPAWAYMAIPSLYPHALGQWMDQLRELAEAEGFAITHWYVDHGWRRDLRLAMITRRRGAEVKALLVPHIDMLVGIDDLIVVSGAGIYSTATAGNERQRLATSLGLQIFVLSEEFPAIIPPHAQPPGEADGAPAEVAVSAASGMRHRGLRRRGRRQGRMTAAT